MKSKTRPFTPTPEQRAVLAEMRAAPRPIVLPSPWGSASIPTLDAFVYAYRVRAEK